MMELLLYQSEFDFANGTNSDGVPSLHDAVRLLHENDPTFKFLRITLGRHRESNEKTMFTCHEEFERFGQAIKKNKTVERLEIGGYFNAEHCFSHLPRILEGISGNRSLRHVKLYWLKGETEQVISSLESFVENNSNLDSIQVSGCQMTFHAMRSLMTGLSRRGSPLDSIEIFNSFVENEHVKEMVSFFEIKPEMAPRRLSLGSNRISDDGCVFISEIVGNDECKLEVISLNYNGGIGVPGIRSIVVAASSRRQPLKKFDFSVEYITTSDDFVLAFAEVFSSNPDLLPDRIILPMQGSEIGRVGLQIIANIFTRRNAPINALIFSTPSSVASECGGLSILLQAFVANPIATPKFLMLSCDPPTQELWDELHLDLAQLLRCHDCSLEELDLRKFKLLSDNVIIRIETSLARNTTLKSLRMDTRNLTMRGKDSLLALICDTTSITSMYNSNHTLYFLGGLSIVPMFSSYLQLNKKVSDKRLVAIAKIFHAHFARDFRPSEWDSVGASVLAQMVACICRGFMVWNEAINVDENKVGKKKRYRTNNCLTVNYLMVRNLPAFFNYVKSRWERKKLSPDL